MSGAEGRGPVRLAFTYTEDEYIEAARYFFTGGDEAKFRLYVALGFIACALFFAWLAGGPYIWAVVSLGALLAVGAGWYTRSLLPRMHFRRNPKFREPYDLTFAEEGILFRSLGMETRLEWGFYSKAIETPDFFFLVYGKDMFSLVPKRAFRDRREESGLREMMRRKLAGGVEARGLPAGGAPAEYVPPGEPPDWR